MIFDELVRCRPFLEPALAHADGTYLWDDVAAAIYAGRTQFWPLERSAIVTELQITPRKRFLNIFLAGGSLEELRGFVPQLEDFARSHECNALQLQGRPGWARVLPGWDSDAPILRRETARKDLT